MRSLVESYLMLEALSILKEWSLTRPGKGTNTNRGLLLDCAAALLLAASQEDL